MSSAPEPHGHDEHDHHAFTGEPVKVLPPDEPRTPGWLPLLGVALFTGAAVAAMIGHDAETPAAPSAAKPEQVAAPTPPPAPPPPALGPPARPGVPSPPSVATAPTLNPEQMDRLRKVLDTSKARGAAPAR